MNLKPCDAQCTKKQVKYVSFQFKVTDSKPASNKTLSMIEKIGLFGLSDSFKPEAGIYFGLQFFLL